MPGLNPGNERSQADGPTNILWVYEYQNRNCSHLTNREAGLKQRIDFTGSWVWAAALEHGCVSRGFPAGLPRSQIESPVHIVSLNLV